MKKKATVIISCLILIVAALRLAGVGFYSSSSAVRDLKAELETIYGKEYTGKAVENGTEDMVFVVEPKTWFLTNWNLRNALGLDYEYECKVIFTTYAAGNEKTAVTTITYRAVNPMGAEEAEVRAHLVMPIKSERTEIK